MSKLCLGGCGKEPSNNWDWCDEYFCADMQCDECGVFEGLEHEEWCSRGEKCE